MSFIAFAPRRSGQHAIGHWICTSHDRYPWWWNDVKWTGYYPDGDPPPEEHGFDPEVHRVGYDPGHVKMHDGDRSTPYVSVESRKVIDYDYVLDYMRDEFKADPQRILILRNVKATTASSEVETPGDFFAVWEAHAQRWLDGDDEGIVRIAFDHWLVDPEYRQYIADQLGLPSCPDVPDKQVNGSSFGKGWKRRRGAPIDTQAVLNRGDLVKTEIPERLLAMSKEIFG